MGSIEVDEVTLGIFVVGLGTRTQICRDLTLTTV